MFRKSKKVVFRNWLIFSKNIIDLGKNNEKNKLDSFSPYAKILQNLQELWSEAEYTTNK